MSDHTRTLIIDDDLFEGDREVEVIFSFRDGEPTTHDNPAAPHEIDILSAVCVESGEDMISEREQLIAKLYELDPYDLMQEPLDQYGEMQGDLMRDGDF